MPKPALFTIGYELKKPEEYLEQLREAGVTILCDVRANPRSRKPGFSKKALAAACERAGIRYEHLPELGIPTDQRRDVKTPAEKKRLFTWYARTVLPKQKPAVQRIASWVRNDHERVALTCFERDACECHRHCIADLLEREKLTPPASNLP